MTFQKYFIPNEFDIDKTKDTIVLMITAFTFNVQSCHLILQKSVAYLKYIA